MKEGKGWNVEWARKKGHQGIELRLLYEAPLCADGK
jgi:hypothetical protein